MMRAQRALFVSSCLIVGGLGCMAACTDSDSDSNPTPSTDASTRDDANARDGAGGGDSAPIDSATEGAAPTDSAVADAGTDASAVGDAAISDAGAGDVFAVLPKVGLVYAGRYNNIDQRVPSASLGADGRILGYDASATEAPFVTTAVVDGVFSDGFVSASRWTNGNLEGPFYAQSGTKPIPVDDGQHVGIAKIGGDLPATGTATYTLVASTKPTLVDGRVASGAVTSGSLTAQFAGNAGTRIGYSFVVTFSDSTFTLTANGGPAAVGDAGGTFGIADAGFHFTNHGLVVTSSSATCEPDAGACATSGTTRVVFAGPNAERVVVAYVFGGNLATVRRGLLVFQKQ